MGAARNLDELPVLDLQECFMKIFEEKRAFSRTNEEAYNAAEIEFSEKMGVMFGVRGKKFCSFKSFETVRLRLVNRILKK